MDLSPAAERQAEADEADRTWQNAPVLAALARLETRMAQGFADLHEQVQAIRGEGGEITQAKDAILAAVETLRNQVVTLQQAAADAASALTNVQGQLAQAGVDASADAAALQEARATFNTVEQQLGDMAASVNQPPSTDAGAALA
jgi:chromosome segregation ATPase